MSVVDHVNEFRVLGGDPFMNKEMHKVVNKLSKFENNSRIVIYTNATILPKDEQLECLRNKKVGLEITNYGTASRQHDALVELCDFAVHPLHHLGHLLHQGVKIDVHVAHLVFQIAE